MSHPTIEKDQDESDFLVVDFASNTNLKSTSLSNLDAAAAVNAAKSFQAIKQQRHAEWLDRLTNESGAYDQAEDLPDNPFEINLPMLNVRLSGSQNWCAWQIAVKTKLRAVSLDGLLGINFQRPSRDGSERSKKWFLASRFVGMWLLENVCKFQKDLVEMVAARSNYADEIWESLEENCGKGKNCAKSIA